jgi:hypothetical protein
MRRDAVSGCRSSRIDGVRMKKGERHPLRSSEERFWEKVDFDGPLIVPELGVCWVWTGARYSNDYGHFTIGGRLERQDVLAHRFAYETEVGEVPEGLDLDHLCRLHPCVRPTHLEPVTRSVNLQRGVGVGGYRERSNG